ncbi:hypothetical protein DRO21_05360 [archaeon]|nr:MAG: hypothetical protein DRJ36_02335 [Thermoprotei archaeon]RLG63767.1 MAG: hypothetical protein DRO21_05360 [archaeon]
MSGMKIFTPLEQKLLLILLAGVFVGVVVYWLKLKESPIVSEFVIETIGTAVDTAKEGEPNIHVISQKKVNLNTATFEELLSLPGVGPTIANEIIKYREKHKFTKITDIMKVRGIGKKKFARLKDLICVNER